jgi:hypothetical protein
MAPREVNTTKDKNEKSKDGNQEEKFRCRRQDENW